MGHTRFSSSRGSAKTVGDFGGRSKNVMIEAYSLLLTSENMAPCGSCPLMIQPPPGT
jgi:hypothetical protein